MSLGIGGHTSKATVGGADPSTVTTNAITTQAGGSTFWVWVATTATFSSPAVTDNKGNSYVQCGSNVDAWGQHHRRYRCVNGTGGSGHTFTLNTVENSSAYVSAIWVVEITGADTSESLDQQNCQYDTSTSPWNSPSVTTQVADEILLAGCTNNGGGGTTFTAGNSFTKLDEQGAGNTGVTGASGYRIVSSTGSYASEWTANDGTEMVCSIDTFKISAIGAVTPNTGSQGLGGGAGTLGFGVLVPTAIET